MGKNRRTAILLTVVMACSSLCVAQRVRYFKAEHGVAATYVRLGSDGRYTVIDREHVGAFLADEGRWQQNGDTVVFRSKDPKRVPYQATVNTHNGKIFLAITSTDASAGIVIPAEEIKKELDGDPSQLPDHVLFNITAKAYGTETKRSYPFRYIGKER